MPVRSKQLVAATFASGDFQKILYTCPESETTIVRSLFVANGSPVFDATVMFFIDGIAPFERSFLWRANLNAGATGVFEHWWVMMPGQRLIGENQSPLTSTFDVFMSGAQLEGVAD